jgi:hypothetical protein
MLIDTLTPSYPPKAHSFIKIIPKSRMQYPTPTHHLLRK